MGLQAATQMPSITRQFALRPWRWPSDAVQAQLMANLVRVSGLAVVVKLASLGKELLVADRFGLGPAIDAYLLSLVGVAYVANMFGRTAAMAMLPVYARLESAAGRASSSSQTDACAAARLATTVLCCATLGLVVVTGLALSAATWAARLAEAHWPGLPIRCDLLYILSPAPLAAGWSALLGTVLNARGRYALVAAAPLVMPVCIGSVLLLAGNADIRTLAWATTAAYLAETAVLALAAIGCQTVGRPDLRQARPWLREVGQQYGVILGSAALLGSMMLIDQAMAAALGPGSVSALNYGSRLTALSQFLVAGSMAAVVLPHFASLVSGRRWSEVRRSLITATGLALLVSVPATLVVALASQPLVEWIFQRGAFSAADSALVARVQALHILQLPALVTGLIGARLLVAMQRNRALLRVNLVNVVINIGGNLLLMPLLGVAGIALATSLVYSVSALLIFRVLRIELRRAETSDGSSQGGAAPPRPLSRPHALTAAHGRAASSC